MSDTITTSIVDSSWHTGLPASGRVPLAQPRLRSTTAVELGITGHKCALIQDVVDCRSAMTAAVEGAFPGSDAWSPPI